MEHSALEPRTRTAYLSAAAEYQRFCLGFQYDDPAVHGVAFGSLAAHITYKFHILERKSTWTRGCQTSVLRGAELQQWPIRLTEADRDRLREVHTSIKKPALLQRTASTR